MKLAPGPQHLKQEKGKSREKKGKRGSSKLVKIEEKEHAAFSVPWEEPPLLRVLVFFNWKQLIVKPYICLPQRNTRHACAPGRERRGELQYETGVDAHRKRWIKPLKETNLGVAPTYFWPLKETILNFDYMNWVNKTNWKYIYIFFISSSAILKETFTAKYNGVFPWTP